MSRKALTPREVDDIVGEIRARPFDLETIAEQFSISPLTLRRIGRANGIHFGERS